MASLATVSRPSFSLLAAAMRAGRAVAQVWKALRNRRDFYRLGEMTDAELADIGLTRADLNVAVALPLTADRTAQLGAVANARIRSIEDAARRVI